jgi:hypothetical protein
MVHELNAGGEAAADNFTQLPVLLGGLLLEHHKSMNLCKTNVNNPQQHRGTVGE